MTGVLPTGNGVPLVAVVSRAPIVYEALVEAFSGLASLAFLDPARRDLDGLLASLSPDAVVVDADEDAERTAAIARAARSPLVQLSLREPAVRIFVDGSWRETTGGSASPDGIRNLVVGTLFGRKRLE
jgi:hypothetical protein